MKRIIITGATGFIGKYITNRLREEGYDLYLITRRTCECYENCTTLIIDNLTSESAPDKCCSVIGKADTMIHLAADITVPGNAITVGNNIDGMFAALEIARRTRVHHFVYLSSIPVIGQIEYTPIDEQHRVRPETPYHWSKYLCEQMLICYKDYFETITTVRIPSPIGVGMKANNFLSNVLKQMKSNSAVEMYGNGKRIQNYIDVRDIANALLRVVELEPAGLFLLAGERSVSNEELVNICQIITGSSSMIYQGRFPDPEETEKWIISSNKAKSTFGFQPCYDIKDTVRWIAEEIK